MELQFHAPVLRWRSLLAAEVPPTSVPEARVTVAFPQRENDEHQEIRSHIAQLPCAFTLSFDDEQELLKQKHVVEFKAIANGKVVATHRALLRDCIPVLDDVQIEWRERVTEAKQETELHVQIPISTNRRPRDIIANALTARDAAVSVARKLALHKNAVAVGLLPPILGCFVGVVLTSPVWIPLTLFIGILGFPLWLVVGVAGSLIIAICAVSSVITVKTIQSRRVKNSLRELAQSPGGQYMLFADAGGNKTVPSASELAEKLKIYVNDDPSRKLLASLAIDFIGNATFVVPVLGEFADMLWAPASASFVSAMYSESTPSAKYFAFIEEFLPFTDFIPTATLAWLKENFSKDEIRKLVSSLRQKRA